ncbi:hypothetical protein D3C87_2168820 [compost metagenome]
MTKYRCRKGYTRIIGSVLIKIWAALMLCCDMASASDWLSAMLCAELCTTTVCRKEASG